MLETVTALFDVGFFAALIRISTPLILATLGEVYNERAGVLNLGIEGIMLLGAMVGFTATWFSGNLAVGVLAALVTGALAGLIMALLTVVLGVSQHVSGIGMTLLASGFAFYLYRLIFGQPAVPPNIVAMAPVPIPGCAAETSRGSEAEARSAAPADERGAPPTRRSAWRGPCCRRSP